MASAVVAVTHRLAAGAVMAAAVVAMIVVRWWERLTHQPALAAAEASLALGTAAILQAVVLILAFRPGPATSRRILGAVLAYIWGHAYRLIDLFVADAFTKPVTTRGDKELR